MKRKINSKSKYKKVLLVRFNSALVEKSRPSAHFCPSLPLKYIESLLAQSDNIRIKLIDCHIRQYSIEKMMDTMQTFFPDILVVDINSCELSTAIEHLTLAKKRNASLIIIAIGRDPTVNFNYYLGLPDLFDIILPGEAEREVSSVLNVLNRGESIRNLRRQYQARFLQEGPFREVDLDSLPFPKYNEYEIKRYRFLYPTKINRRVRWGYILSSRGCPYPCSFCSPAIRKTHGKKIRVREAIGIVNEIKHLIDNYKVNVLCFEDDNFTTVRSHVEDVCNEILKQKIKIKWIAHARADNLDYSLLKLMKKAGCDLLRFGIESGSPRIIHLLEKSSGSDWVEKSARIFNYAKRLKISTHALFMIGNPTETEDDIRKTFDSLKQLKPDFIQVHFFTPYPGSKLYEHLKPSLNNINLSQMHHYAQPPMTFSQIGIEELKEWRRLFYKKILFSPRGMLNHAYHYGLFYLFNQDIFRELLKMRMYMKGSFFENNCRIRKESVSV